MKVDQDQDPAEFHSSSDDAADVDDWPLIPARSYCQNWFSMMFRMFLKLTSDAISWNSSRAGTHGNIQGQRKLQLGIG